MNTTYKRDPILWDLIEQHNKDRKNRKKFKAMWKYLADKWS
tara:strand:- start:35280 stop:35402 length:123 start_codon:yes stop_codon:yes gene_type:complete